MKDNKLIVPVKEAFQAALDDWKWSLLSIFTRGMGNREVLRMIERVAYHEAGHTLISLLVSPSRRISEVTIIGEQDLDGHVGITKSLFWHQKPQSKETILQDLQVSLAGRIAEQKFVGHSAGIDEGTSSDLKIATDNAWNAITAWGMDDEFGPFTLETCKNLGGLSTGYLFDLAQQRLQKIMKENYQITEKLINDNWRHIEVLAQLLLDKNTITMEQVFSAIPELAMDERGN